MNSIIKIKNRIAALLQKRYSTCRGTRQTNYLRIRAGIFDTFGVVFYHGISI